MARIDRIVAYFITLVFAISALRWIFDPRSAAEALGLPLLDGLARSTEIGDLGAFFLACATMIGWGAASANPSWLRAAALLVGCAALVRTIAWAFHGAAFAAPYIAVEVVAATALATIAARLD